MTTGTTTAKASPSMLAPKTFEGIITGFSKTLNQLDILVAQRQAQIGRNRKAIQKATGTISALDLKSVEAAEEIERAEIFQRNLKNLIGK